MNHNWTYHSPVAIQFGDGCRRALHQAPTPLTRRTVWVVDPVVAATPLYLEFLAACDPAPAAVWTEMRPNPTLDSVDNLAQILREIKADQIVAIGGGSALDTAKAAACAAATGISVEELHAGRRAPERALPLIVLPTTAGTGSEVTAVAVLTDPRRGVKAPIAGPALYPRLALVDPEWTYTVPPAVTAATGIDALSHALEAYWSVHHQPICDALAEQAAELILTALPTAFAQGADRAARAQMALGSLLAGLAFAQPKTAAVHACSFPLTQRFGLSHGVACGLTLDAFLRFNAKAVPERLQRLARRLGYDDVDGLARAIRELKHRLGLPATLSDAGIDAGDVAVLVEESFHPNMRNNPREVTHADLRHLYETLGEDHDA